MRDWWEKRELDRRLAGELASAYENYRLASFKMNEIAAAAPPPAPGPEPGSAVQQAGIARTMAYDQYIAVLERWKHFVIHGALPQEHEASAGARSKQCSTK